MNKYRPLKIKESISESWYVIVDNSSMRIVEEPTKYLKHKLLENCSPNTVCKLAHSISYYYSYMDEICMTIVQVLNLKYAEQYAHFVAFLYWLKEGHHTDRQKLPNNATCDSYLEAVFGYIRFLLIEYELPGELTVLESRDISYNGTAGVRYTRGIKTFRGYLKKEPSKGKTIEEDKILKLIEASDSIRNILLILLFAETGFRIGEILGIRYAQDIDYDKHTIRVLFRQDNENAARAKNAEYRRAKISDETFEILMCYISEYRRILDKSEYLFVNLSGPYKGRPMNKNGVYSALKNLSEKTGIEVTPHMLRHYFANDRRKHGWSIELISKALGHKKISTTELYMNVKASELSEASEQYFKDNTGLYNINKII